MDSIVIPTREDLDALIEFAYGKANQYHGMSYADGIRDMVDWLEGHGDRPDIEEE